MRIRCNLFVLFHLHPYKVSGHVSKPKPAPRILVHLRLFFKYISILTAIGLDCNYFYAGTDSDLGIQS